ncbi:MAG: MBL fold metallo-hydrolase [Dehalococcoidia bacterium]|nr:MBL fold metallo-hydrolase [Dehalococcoidia bacterium]
METHEFGDLRVIRCGPLGPYGNNAYAIADERSREAVAVDMPSGSDELVRALQGFRVKAILLTHTHPDHWAEYDSVKQALAAPVLCHPDERIMPREKSDGPLADGQEIAAGPYVIRCLHTPGHTPGSTCLLVERFLLSGDVLFPGGPGRTQTADDLRQSIASITGKLYTLPDETLMLPGHGGGTTIGESRREYAGFASRPHAADLCGDVSWEM